MSRGVAAGRLALLAILAGAVLLAGGPAVAQDTGWVIESFDTHLRVAADGTLAVTETIEVDFGTLDKHGIFRDIPVRFEVPPEPWYELPEDTDPGALLRAIDISDIRVSSETAPDEVELTRPGPTGGTHLRIRIGDPDRTVSGRHTYVIGYRVEGALDAPEGRPELFWNTTGTGWGVPIRRATAGVEGPGPVVDTNCFRGGFGSTEACQAAGTEFSTTDLRPGEGMSVAVAWRPAALEVPEPLLVEAWSLGRALVGSDAALPLTALAALLGFGGVGLLAYRQGRDRVTVGDATVDQRARGSPSTGQRRRRLLEPRTVPVEFRPPEDLRPAELGLLVDESVDPVDVSATVVDLAVRGHLQIEEVEEGWGWFSRTDWRLRRTEPAAREDVAQPAAREDVAEAADAGEADGQGPQPPRRGGLMHYEQLLLDGLFADGDEVLLSDLKGGFADTYGQVQRAVYSSAQQRRWFASRPDKTRSLWLGLGIGALVATGGLLVAAVLFTTVALAVVPLVLAAAALLVAHRWMPHRTPRGSRLLTRTLGFREFITTAEADRMDFAEKERLFVGYLPYAVLFGATEHWARVFAELGVDLGAATGFYVGSGGFHAAQFSGAVSDFSGTVGTALSTTPSSGGSGGGFSGGGSGGGFGGGGGGSW